MKQHSKPTFRLLNTEQAAASSSLHRVEDPVVILASAFDIPLPDKSVQMVVTSPPYFNLRKYANGTENDFGREETEAAYVQRSVECLREIRRVLVDDGVVFWVIGDSYDDKSLRLVPFQVAEAAKQDGWILRDVIIWHKPNCIPESVRDRCTCSYELIPVLAKQKKNYWNHDEAREPAVSTSGKMSPPIGNAKHQAMGKATLKGNRTLRSRRLATRRPRASRRRPTKMHMRPCSPRNWWKLCIHCEEKKAITVRTRLRGQARQDSWPVS